MDQYEITVYEPDVVTVQQIIKILNYLYYSNIETVILNEINVDLN